MHGRTSLRAVRKRFAVSDDKKAKLERSKSRDARLAEQLRANLSKRKALVKGKKAGGEKREGEPEG